MWDKLVKERIKVDKDYMEYEMIKWIMQSVWRSIRHKEDYCKTYVLDSSFEYWMKKNKSKMPKYFMTA